MRRPGSRLPMASMGQALLPPSAPPPVPSGLPPELRDVGAHEAHIRDTRAQVPRLEREAAKCDAETERLQRAADDLAGEPGEAEANLMAHDSRARCERIRANLAWVHNQITFLEYALEYRLSIPPEEEPEPFPEAEPTPPVPPPGPPGVFPPGGFQPVETPAVAAPRRFPVATETASASDGGVPEAPTACPPGAVLDTATGLCVPEGAAVATPTRFPGLTRLLPLVGGLPGPAPVPFSMGRSLGQAAGGREALLRERSRLAALALQAVEAASGMRPGDPVTAQTVCSLATQIDAINRQIGAA